MRKIIQTMDKLPSWCGICIIILYSMLTAEYSRLILYAFPFKNILEDIFSIFIGISFIVYFLSGFVVWIIYALLFYLTARLFGGNASFNNFLYLSSYSYIAPIIMLIISIVMLDNVQIQSIEASNINIENSIMELMENKSFRLARKMIDISFILYYLMIVIFINYLFKIKYIFAILSVLIPVISLWLITEFFKFI